LFLKILKFLFLCLEKIKLLIILLHLKTLGCLPIIFLFNSSWKFLVQYFIFQVLGRVFIEIGYSFLYFWNDLFIFIGILLKLGLLPFFWWFPSFLKKKNWRNFFFFNTLKKIPLFYFIRLNFPKNFMLNIFFLILGLGFLGLFISSKKIVGLKKIKMFLGWVSILDGVFFCFLIFFDKNSFFVVYLIYTIIYFLIRLRFFFCLKTFKIENFSFKFSSIKNFIFFFCFFLLFLKIGFPPFFPFLYKVLLVSNISKIFRLNFLYFFFFVNLFQAIIYLFIFFKILKKKYFVFFKKISMFFFGGFFLIFGIFFFVFFW
jgi:NADH:ubiquinone oxidoreductase subunit 2 (subunit N)